MTFLIPTHTQAHEGLRAIKTALTAAGPLDDLRRAAVAAVQRHLLRTDHDFDALGTITPAELARAIDDPALRAQLVGGMATLVLAREPVDPREIAVVESFAEALGVHPSALDQLRRLHDERMIMLRIDAARRGLAGPAIAQLYEDEGFLGVLKNVASVTGIRENRPLAERYHALESFADGTLGKELWRFYKRHGYAFPGEKHGAPESLLTHDLSHVLGGYETDFASEGLVLGFQAGYRKQDPFAVLVFLLLQGQQGVKLTIFAEAHHGFFNDKPELVEGIVRAFARGARMKVDLTDRWDFWAVMDRPVEELRERYGIAAA
ncbi:MAG: hypothetical protein QM820_33450 [Minicystis sp.]